LWQENPKSRKRRGQGVTNNGSSLDSDTPRSPPIIVLFVHHANLRPLGTP